MKRVCLSWFILLCGAPFCVAPAGAQDIAPISQLRTPASPAFTLLGVEPSAVERPGTPSDLAFTLLNQAKDISSAPKNFALDVGPYWLMSHPGLKWTDDKERSWRSSLARTTSISVATAQPSASQTNSGMGIGIRSSLLSGHLSPAASAALTELEGQLKTMSEAYARSLNEAGAVQLDKDLAAGKLTPEQHAAAKKNLAQGLKKIALPADYQKQAKDATALVNARQGFIWDFAAAWTWDFADATWETHRFRKWGVWSTPSYQSLHWSALGVIRYLRDTQVSDERDVLEVGGRGVYSTTASTLSLEYVTRSVRNSTVDGKHRLVVIGEHRVTDVVWLTATFGRDRVRADSQNTFLAQIGMSLNLSQQRYKFD